MRVNIQYREVTPLLHTDYLRAFYCINGEAAGARAGMQGGLGLSTCNKPGSWSNASRPERRWPALVSGAAEADGEGVNGNWRQQRQ